MDEKILAWVRELGFGAIALYLIVRVDRRLLKISLTLERLLEKAGIRHEHETTPRGLREIR